MNYELSPPSDATACLDASPSLLIASSFEAVVLAVTSWATFIASFASVASHYLFDRTADVKLRRMACSEVNDNVG